MGDRVRALAVPSLLVAIAALGVYRSATLDQSSWQGASFGMFATYDNGSSRTVIVTVTGPDGVARMGLPASLRDDATRLREVPTDDAAASLAARALKFAPDDATRADVAVWRLVLHQEAGLTVRTAALASGSAER